MQKGKKRLLELILSGMLLFAAEKCVINAGSSSKSFPVKLSSQTSPEEYPAKINVDVKFGKADGKYYSNKLEVMLSTEDFQKEKKFYQYKTITKNRSSLYLIHDKEVEVGKINEEVYVHKMKNGKMTGKWQTINSEDDKEYKKIRKVGKYVHAALNFLGKVTLIEDILEESTDVLSYFENKNRDEALESLKTRYMVTEIPFHYPVQGEMTAWKFNIYMKKSGKSYLAIIPIVNIKQGSVTYNNEIEGRFEGALINVPQDETTLTKSDIGGSLFNERQKTRIPALRSMYENARNMVKEEPNDLKKIELAISLYHCYNEGDYPAFLEDLVPDYFEFIPLGSWNYDSKTGNIKKE